MHANPRVATCSGLGRNATTRSPSTSACNPQRASQMRQNVATVCGTSSSWHAADGDGTESPPPAIGMHRRAAMNTTRMLGLGAYLLAAACDAPGDPGDRGLGAGIEDDRAQSPTCASLGYAGTCVGDVSVWSEGGKCRVRDCGGEEKACGFISAGVGYGCLGGPQGSSTFDCASVGYEGECLSGDVLVWTDGNACKWADCGASGQTCAWTDAVGNDCVEEDGDDDDGDGGGEGPLVVAGTQLSANQAKWVQHVAEEIVPQMIGTRSQRIAKAAEVAWWSLKEGVLDLANPLVYSNCHFPPDQH